MLNFMIYAPGSRNTNFDALSWLESVKENNADGKTIISESCWLNSIPWDFCQEFQVTLPHYEPEEYTQNKQYVPAQKQMNHLGKQITWAHTTQALGILALVELNSSSMYWWPEITN